MTQELVPYEQALALKELGFDELCFAYYEDNNELTFGRLNDIGKKRYLQTPLFQQAFRWFREKYGALLRYDWGEVPHFLMIQIEMTKGKTYEEAELACLMKLIEIVKEKK